MHTNSASEIITALAWSLGHSLWQGLLLALVVAMLLPKMSSALARYRLAYAALVGIFLLAAATFYVQFEKLQTAPTAVGKTILLTGENSFQTIDYQRVSVSESKSGLAIFREKTVDWFAENQAFIVGLWLVGCLFFLLKLMGAWFFTERLKTRRTSRLADDFERLFADLSRRLPLDRPVRLLESALVGVPMTIGWLRPVVLLPIGLVNHLSIDEVEAVLAHELAHISRRDWLANLAQSFVESLFYYHPAVWWLSAVVRDERENVADDLAIFVTGGSPIGYVKTLVSIQESALFGQKPALALAFSGKNDGSEGDKKIDKNSDRSRNKKSGSLLARAQRILFQQQPIRSSAMEKITATALILGLAVALSLTANPAKPVVEKLAQLASDPVEFFEDLVETTDSLPKSKLQGTGHLTFDDGKQKIEFRLEKDELTFLKIDDREIPAAEFAAHESHLADLISDLRTPLSPPSYPDSPTGRGGWIGTFSEGEIGEPNLLSSLYILNADGKKFAVSTDSDGKGNAIVEISAPDGQKYEVRISEKGKVFFAPEKTVLKNGTTLFAAGQGSQLHFSLDGEAFKFEGGEVSRLGRMNPARSLRPLAPLAPMAPLAPFPPFAPRVYGLNDYSFGTSFGSGGAMAPMIWSTDATGSSYLAIPPGGSNYLYSFDGDDAGFDPRSGTTINGTLNDLDIESDFDENGDGSIQFSLENGDSKKIEVRGGEAFFDGKKLEKGGEVALFGKKDENDFEAISYNGQHVFRLKKGKLTWEPADADDIKRRLKADRETALRDRETAFRDMETARRDQETAYSDARIHQREALRELETQQRELEQQARELEAHRREMEADERAARRETETARREAIQAEREAAKAEREAVKQERLARRDAEKAQKWSRAMQAQLVKDGFDSKNFTLKMSRNSLKINGKGQSDEMLAKYLALYSEVTGDPITGDFQMTYSESE